MTIPYEPLDEHLRPFVAEPPDRCPLCCESWPACECRTGDLLAEPEQDEPLEPWDLFPAEDPRAGPREVDSPIPPWDGGDVNDLAGEMW